MPELPEVETVVREVRPHLLGRKFISVWVSRHSLRRRWSRAWENQLVGLEVRAVYRRGKWILIEMSGPWLVIHLGMTGQLTVVHDSDPVASHTHLILGLDGLGWQLRFRDVRRFGSATFFPGPSEVEDFFHARGLGPEPFALEPAYWVECLAMTRRCIKAILLDQRVVAGVGNIYADESLFEARLHPARLGCDLDLRETTRLRQAIVRVLKRAIDKRGSSIRDYVGGSGLKGAFQKEFRVYGRTALPCRRCETPIVRTILAGRSTHYCPACQPEPTAGRLA